jgi:hypothetical protein
MPMSGIVEIYNPIAPTSEGWTASRPDLESLRGKVIGFIDNAKPNFNFLVDDLAQLLVERHGAARVIKHRKPGQVPVAQPTLDALAAECDVVIAGSGD